MVFKETVDSADRHRYRTGTTRYVTVPVLVPNRTVPVPYRSKCGNGLGEFLK
jgi:hypothetical protein